MEQEKLFKVIYDEFYLKQRKSEDILTISNAWEKCFLTILKQRFDFNSQARKTLFAWGEYGFNWKLLHPQEDKSYQEFKEEFFDEVAYCSDRMDFDRLLRCHHLFRLMVHAYKSDDAIVKK